MINCTIVGDDINTARSFIVAPRSGDEIKVQSSIFVVERVIFNVEDDLCTITLRVKKQEEERRTDTTDTGWNGFSSLND